MKKRMIVMLAAVWPSFVAASGLVKFRQIQAGDRAGRVVPAAAGGGHDDRGPARSAGRRRSAPSAPWQAVQGVTVSADLPGVVERDRLRLRARGARGRGAGAPRHPPGAGAARGRARRSASSRASTSTARAACVERGHRRRRRTTTAPSAEHKQAEARVGEIRATIERKTIRAPFSGILGHPPGQPRPVPDRAAIPIVPLQSLDPIYVNFSVPQQEVGRAARRAARCT